MSGGYVCRCEEARKPVAERAWAVTARRCNHSAFNGWHRTPSDYSEVRCYRCMATWRTKAGYVNQLPDWRHGRELGAQAAVKEGGTLPAECFPSRGRLNQSQ